MVDDTNSTLELGQNLDPGLDAVERLAHVEAPDRYVVTAEEEPRVRRRQHPGRDADVAPRVDDAVVGLLRPAEMPASSSGTAARRGGRVMAGSAVRKLGGIAFATAA